MAAKFEIFKDASGGFRFRLKSANGEPVASSESYSSKEGAKGGIDSIKRIAADAEVVDLT